MNKADLMKYDFILLMDKSGSMATPDCPGGKSRWDYAKETVIGVAAKCTEYDNDGITVGFFAKKLTLHENITGALAQVNKMFDEHEPGNSTDTAAALKHVLDQYFAAKEAAKTNVELVLKPIIVIVVTDGQPDSKADLKKVIIDATQKMDADEEIGITFLQIGTDADATKFLKELDDELVPAGAKFDIVDTKTTEEMEDMTITDVLIAALED